MARRLVRSGNATAQNEYFSSDLLNAMSTGRAVVGRYSYGWPRIVTYDESSRLVIGQFCSLAAEVMIVLGGEHHAERITSFPLSVFLHGQSMTADSWSRGNVTIGNDVWIGRNAVLLSGAHIGHGAVVGACAVVGSEVPPYAIVVGNPARVLRYRFEPSVCEKLLEIRWWDWSEETIRTQAVNLLTTDAAGFVAAQDEGRA